MGSILLRGARAAAILILLVAPAAHAQQYEDETGDLDLTVAVSITVSISGEGFVADSVVYVTLTSADGETEVDLGTVPLDDQGRFFAEMQLPEDLPDGVYFLSATGVTAQGATRVLTARVGVGAELSLEIDEPATTTSSTSATDTTVESGSDPTQVETTATTAPAKDPKSPSVPPVLFLGLGAAGGIALGGGWWWIYRAIRK